MRRIGAVIALTLSLAAFAHSQSFNELLAQRLEESVAYREAVLALRQSEVLLSGIDAFYVPYLSLEATGFSNQTTVDGVDPSRELQFVPSASFTNVFGATVALQLPITPVSQPLQVPGATSEELPFVGNPQLVVSRALFEEQTAERLEAEAAVALSFDALDRAYQDVRIGLVQEIFLAWSTQESLRIAELTLQTAEDAFERSNDDATLRDLDLARLQARRDLLAAEQSLSLVDDEIAANAETLYEELRLLVPLWAESLPVPLTRPDSTPTLAALELQLAAADERESFAFLGYVPNPTFSAIVEYDIDASEWFWGISAEFTVPLLDRGERALAVVQRREEAAIAQLRLDQTRDGLNTAVQNEWQELSIIELDRQINLLRLNQQEEDTARSGRLFEEGFVTQTTHRYSEIALMSVSLQMEQTDQRWWLQQLELLRYFSPIGAEDAGTGR